MNTNLFGVKGTAEKVIGDGVYHRATVQKSNVVFDRYGNTYICLCVHCEGEDVTLYPMFKATPNNIKGLLLGCDNPNQTFNIFFYDLFPKGKTFDMKFDRREDGLEILSIQGNWFNGEISFDGEGVNNDVETLSI